MTARRRITVLSAGLRAPSSSRRLADALAGAARLALEGRGVPVDVAVVEVREHAAAVVAATLDGLPDPALRRAIAAVTQADGLVAVTPIFTGSYSGLFKTFVDLLEPAALEGVPVLLGASGGSERHSLALDHALRPLFTSLHAAVVPTGVYASAADRDDLAGRIRRAGRQLAEAVAARPPAVEEDLEDLLHSLDRSEGDPRIEA